MGSDSQEKDSRNKKLSRKWRLLLITSGMVLMALSHKGMLPKGHTSILCDDPSIRRTYTTDTINDAALLLMSTLGAFANILVLEWVLPPKSCGDIRRALSRAWRLFKDLFHGQLIMLLVIEFFKLAICEARPHFIQTCGPNLTNEVCEDGYVELTWHNCTNPMGLPKSKIEDSMKSFPSSHAGLGAFIALYMTRYLCSRLQLQWSQWLTVCLCLLWGTWGSVCGVSRIWDNRHHWWDVAVGAIVGAAAAHATVRHLSLSFLSPEPPRPNTVEPSSAPAPATTPHQS